MRRAKFLSRTKRRYPRALLITIPEGLVATVDSSMMERVSVGQQQWRGPMVPGHLSHLEPVAALLAARTNGFR